MRAGNEKSRRHWIWDDHPYLITVIIACVVIGLKLFFYIAGD
jgi:hypothetical protein